MTEPLDKSNPSPESLLPAEIYAKYKAAFEMIDALNRKNGPGGREWVMSIPARPGYDPDIVIWEAIVALRDGLVEAIAREERLVNATLGVLASLSVLEGAGLMTWANGGRRRIIRADAAIAASREARGR